MPHATNMPFPGFQAIILCGPGVSLNTFTANPEDFPKALVPIANRPMVWYAMDWCYRLGITDIYLITPHASYTALSAALSQNPYLTSLPSPKADIIAPKSLDHTTPTAEILRLPEVRTAITSDFLVLPCDLVSELQGESLLESWMVMQSTLDYPQKLSVHAGPNIRKFHSNNSRDQKGGLGVYYETRGSDHVKGAETDFIITTALHPAPAPPSKTSLRPHISKLLYETTTDTLKDITEAQKGLPLRHGLIRKNGRIRMLTTHRDAHVYLFPHWVLDWVRQNEKFDSISEDVVGWWAKAGWQDGLAEKLHLGSWGNRSTADVLKEGFEERTENENADTNGQDFSIDLPSMSSTYTTTFPNGDKADDGHKQSSPTSPPQILAYIHPTTPSSTPQPPSAIPMTLIRRVDTPHLLLSTSLYIATLSPTSPLAHNPHISSAATIAPHTTVHEPSTLIGANTSVAKHCTIKSCSIGSNCVIEASVKLTGCLLMDGVVVKEKAVLQGTILGRRSEVGLGARLESCQVPEGYAVPEAREAKGEVFAVGLEDDGGDDEQDGEVEEEEGIVTGSEGGVGLEG